MNLDSDRTLLDAAVAPAAPTLTFAELGVAPPLLRALAELQYNTPTPIQAQSIPSLLQGRDMFGCAQTGTGKTAAFALPVLQQFLDLPLVPTRERLRALILAPTRELALQIEASLRDYAKYVNVRTAVIFGGVGQEPQVQALRRGVDILVATPGRLLDLHGQGLLYLGAVQYLILDEADRMLDMGFVRDVKKIVAEVPRRKQTLLFSATMAPEIRSLAADLLRNPLEVAVTPAARTADRIDQFVFHIAKADKRILLERFLRDPAVERCVVFTRTKHGADKVARGLDQIGVSAAAIHGNRSQSQRVRALDGFKSGEVRVLVATDIAARGLDIDGVSHVINFELPNEPDSYVHRIGRTARNGATGIAMAMCDQEEVSLLRDIEKRIGQAIPVAEIAGLTLPTPAGRPQAQAAQPRQQQQRHGQSQGRGGPQQSRGGQQESQRDGQRGAPQRGYQPQARPSQPQARPSQPQASWGQPQTSWGQPQAQAGQPQGRPDRGFPQQGQRSDRPQSSERSERQERPAASPGGDSMPRRRDRQRLPDMAAKPAQNDLHAPVNRDWY